LRSNGRVVKVDSLLLDWKGYGVCVAYVTARDVNATYVSCDGAAPAYVGIGWAPARDGLEKLNVDAQGESYLLLIPKDRFPTLVKGRPRASDEWQTSYTEADILASAKLARSIAVQRIPTPME
jgi:hypothetical protein